MKTALVTGGGTGIGRATALRLANDGYHVAVAGRRPDPLEKVAAEIRALKSPTPLQSLALSVDVSREDQVQSMIDRTLAAWGRLDLLVNNAGMALSSTLAQLAPRQWQQLIDTNLSSAFFATRAVWPTMQRQSAGVIINISSMASRDPFPGLGAYGIAKLALNMLTLVTAREGAPHNIRAYGIAPGAVETPMFAQVFPGKQIPPDIMMQPEHIAEVAAQMANGSLLHAAGETLFLHRKPA